MEPGWGSANGPPPHQAYGGGGGAHPGQYDDPGAQWQQPPRPPQPAQVNVFNPAAYQQQHAAQQPAPQQSSAPLLQGQMDSAQAGMGPMGAMGGGLAGGMAGMAASVPMDAVQGMATNLAIGQMQQISQQINTNVNRYFSMAMLRYFFQVNNGYVASKIKTLLLPFRHKTWARAQGANGGYAEPRLDINAPDLYLPTMAFVTYIMLIALHLGQEGRFTPEIFSLTASKGLGLVLLEVTATKLVFYLFPAASSGSGAQILDLVAYSGYKFVGVVVSMAAGLVLPSYGRLAVSLYTALCSGFFLLKTLIEVRGAASLTPDVAKQNYCIFGLAGLQVPICWYLART